jgi:hypothetical protein
LEKRPSPVNDKLAKKKQNLQNGITIPSQDYPKRNEMIRERERVNDVQKLMEQAVEPLQEIKNG